MIGADKFEIVVHAVDQGRASVALVDKTPGQGNTKVAKLICSLYSLKTEADAKHFFGHRIKRQQPAA